MTWDEHLDELKKIRTLFENNHRLLSEDLYELCLKELNALEEDRWCRGEDPYHFLRVIISTYIDLAPNLSECNTDGYPVTVREAGRRLRAYEPTSWQVDRLLGYASWLQVNGWHALSRRDAEQLQSEYRHAGVDPELIDFTIGT